MSVKGSLLKLQKVVANVPMACDLGGEWPILFVPWYVTPSPYDAGCDAALANWSPTKPGVAWVWVWVPYP